jgi:putative DNA-invertase from lambdoid prophage Rac
VLVVRWIDRLGRNYADVTEVIREFMKGGIVVRTVINGLVFDGATKDPMQMAVRDALISFMAALSQDRHRPPVFYLRIAHLRNRSLGRASQQRADRPLHRQDD